MKKLISVMLVIVMALTVFVPTASALSGKLDKNIAAETRQIAVDVESEGVVLLKNEDNVLPLEGKKINVFGAGSVLPFIGGAGSGGVTSDNPVFFYEALETAGIEYNGELKALYEKECGGNEVFKTDNTVLNNLIALMAAKSSLDEMPVDKLTDSVMNNAANFSDTAVIVISRTSAEGSDISIDTLRLSSDEKALVEKVTCAFKDVIVLFNTANVMEMGWIEDYENIKAAALIWIPGEFGLEGASKVLSGEVTPSGKLADTVAYNISDHPSSVCFGSHEYKGGDYFVEYLEGIYVGYRYFETFAPEKVQFPFGFGLSYTTFEKSDVKFKNDGKTITATVKVTNTGDRSGKEVVELYYSAPYIPGGIEKSAINLGSFAKTKLLSPGESETLTLTLKIADMASYDYKTEQAWVLDKGDYNIYLSNSVRDHFASYTYNIPEKVVNKYDSKTGTEIKNLFDDVNSGFPTFSRADAEGTYPVFRNLEKTAAVKNKDKTLPAVTTEGEAPKFGVTYDETITLRDVYEDESLWDKFLDQLTFEEMTLLIINGGYETQGIERLGIPATMDNDGPMTIKGRNGLVYVDSGTAYPCETTVACTWNTALAQRLGEGVGKEAKDIGTDIWYAPGANIHRNPMGGRNFEYYSEDPVMSAKMASAVIKGTNSQNLVTTIKHFVLNDQESNRSGLFTWADEQTMREIYLKAFEEPIKEAGSVGVMSAYDRIGASWCGASSALLNDLLRKEWGFEGFVVSDYSSNFTGSGYMSPVLAAYAGNDTLLTGVWLLNKPSHVLAIQNAYKRDPIGFGNAMRAACKNLCMMKMHTKAFLYPDKTYDDSFIGSLDMPWEWKFEFPFILSILRYAFNNVANVIIYAFRYIL